MIEISAIYDEEQNCTRISKIKLVPPFEKRNGVYVELVSRRLERDTDTSKLMSSLGFVNTGDKAPEREATIWVRKHSFWYYRLRTKLYNLYIDKLWWLYTHGRVFQIIPAWESFSWKYFTPFHLALKLKGPIRRHKKWIDGIGYPNEGIPIYRHNSTYVIKEYPEPKMLKGENVDLLYYDEAAEEYFRKAQRWLESNPLLDEVGYTCHVDLNADIRKFGNMSNYPAEHSKLLKTFCQEYWSHPHNIM